jgi:hypothetical protein
MRRHLDADGTPPTVGPSPLSGDPSLNEGHGPLSGLIAFLRSHPILCLLLLSPGIPEYLSSSSPVDAIVLDPGQFLFQLVANLGLYGPGVLLVREAMVRWKKGWASVLLLGAAYGILEEGVALSTLFDSKAGPVGQFGYYGHWLGVNWVWSAMILPVHMIFSISVPILLLGLALPETRGRSLLTLRGIRSVIAILVVDVSGLFLLIDLGEHFFMGYPVLLLSLVAIVGLTYAARRSPSDKPVALSQSPRRRPRVFLVLGIVFYPTVLLTAAFASATHVPAFVGFIAVILVQSVFLFGVLSITGSHGNEMQLIALCSGLIVPIAGIGLIATLAFPLVILADAAMALFLVRLWRRYRRQSQLEHAIPPKDLSELSPQASQV